MALLLQATAKNTVMTYSSLALPIPIVISGTGIEDWISLDDIDGAVVEIGSDGTMSGHVKPAFVKGKLTLQPLSPAINNLIAAMNTQYSTGAVVGGTLTVTNPTGLWEYTIENFVITSMFKGYELAEKVKDVPIMFSGEIPNSSILGDIASIGLGIAGVI